MPPHSSPIPDRNLLQQIMTKAKMGWWRADYNTQTYTASDFVRTLLGRPAPTMHFEDFSRLVRADYRSSIETATEEISNLFLTSVEFPVSTPEGETWVRSEIVQKEIDADGHIRTIGYLQVIPNPEHNGDDRAKILRLNNLLAQLRNISFLLLSFLKGESPEKIIQQILKEILNQFQGGRTYLIEYDWKERTQTCSYEVVDTDIESEKEGLYRMPMSGGPWWLKQICSGKPIVLSSLDDLPPEAASEKEILERQHIQSLLAVPLFSRSGTWGYAGIDIVKNRHRWSNEDIQWFYALINIVSICLELHRSEQEALSEKNYLQKLHDYMPLGYVRLRLLYDEWRQPIDYLFVDANKASQRIYGNANRYIGLTAKEVGIDPTEHLRILTDLLESGTSRETQHFDETVGKYFHAMSYSVEQDEVISLYSDVTEQFKITEALDRSEKILRNMYDNLPVGIELYDKEGKLLDMNLMDLEIFGIETKDAALGIHLFDNPNLPADVIENLRDRKPIAFRLNYPFQRIENYYPSGKRGYIDLFTKVCMLYDAHGEFSNYLFINIDNTEINQAYSKISEFEQSFSLVSQSGKIGYCKFDLLTRTGFGVTQWFRNLGESEETPLDQIIDVYRHVHEADRKALFGFSDQMKSGEISHFNKDLRIQTGEGWRWTRVNVMRNTIDPDPEKLEMICVNYDVTELKETEQKLIEAKNKAEESDRLKSAFLANMSHEIRTPLNAIVGFSDLLVEADDREERQEYIRIVQENNDLLLQLISDILDLSKIEAGTFDFSYADIDINLLCNEIVRTFSLKAKDSGVRIVFEEQMPECRIRTDKNRLNQVLSNFISNALKFTQKGTISLGYRLTPENELRFYVRDTGLGIPPEKIDTIFDRFVKLNNFAQGTGLGLAICKSIAEQMGGRIGVESKVGEGSCFWITHPYTCIVPKKQPEETGRKDVLESGGGRSVLSCKPTLLVAEDTDSNYFLVSIVLKKEFRLVRALNGLEAVQLAETVKPDLILMDLKMPEMDGIAATREIRKSDCAVPIIAVTAFAFDQDRQRALDAGCNEYVSKPINGQALKTMIRELLTKTAPL